MKIFGALTLLLVSAYGAGAGMATLTPVLDSTIHDSSNPLTNPISNGAGQFLFAGNTGGNFNFETRRALLAFDVASTLPANVVIESAILQLTVTMSPPFSGDDPFSLHRALAPWGEGASNPTGNEGIGTASAPGDASWAFREVPGFLWAMAGGDFAAVSSGSANIGVQGLPYQISGPGLVADVQAWLDDPASDYGWFLLGNESGSQTVRQFASRENGDSDSRPQLFVSYRVVPEPTTALLLGVGAGVAWLRRKQIVA